MTAIEFRPAAGADLEEAADWYEAKRSGLGLEFLDAAHATLATISENPKLYPALHPTSLSNVAPVGFGLRAFLYLL